MANIDRFEVRLNFNADWEIKYSRPRKVPLLCVLPVQFSITVLATLS